MARVKGALQSRKRHKKILKLAKGFVGARSKQYRIAKQSVMRAMAASFAGRKQTKREYRRLWIARINAAARINGISYSRLMNGLKTAGVAVNRKMLAEIAINDSSAFTVLAQKAKQTINA
jgi:large subunit ribosomal protein L20